MGYGGNYLPEKEHIEEHEHNGFTVYLTRAGQDGSHGPTFYEYEVEDHRGRTEDEVIEYCYTHVHKVDPNERFGLVNHIMKFRDMGGYYIYRVGHDWTG